MIRGARKEQETDGSTAHAGGASGDDFLRSWPYFLRATITVKLVMIMLMRLRLLVVVRIIVQRMIQ